MLWLRHAGFAKSWGELRRPLARATLVYCNNISVVFVHKSSSSPKDQVYGDRSPKNQTHARIYIDGFLKKTVI
jgi:hypothetical protein